MGNETRFTQHMMQVHSGEVLAEMIMGATAVLGFGGAIFTSKRQIVAVLKGLQISGPELIPERYRDTIQALRIHPMPIADDCEDVDSMHSRLRGLGMFVGFGQESRQDNNFGPTLIYRFYDGPYRAEFLESREFNLEEMVFLEGLAWELDLSLNSEGGV